MTGEQLNNCLPREKGQFSGKSKANEKKIERNENERTKKTGKNIVATHVCRRTFKDLFGNIKQYLFNKCVCVYVSVPVI